MRNSFTIPCGLYILCLKDVCGPFIRMLNVLASCFVQTLVGPSETAFFCHIFMLLFVVDEIDQTIWTMNLKQEINHKDLSFLLRELMGNEVRIGLWRGCGSPE